MAHQLSEDWEIARRIAFIRSRVATAVGVPTNSDTATLLQEAMMHPEAVNPADYSLIYLLHSAAPNQETTLAPR